MKDKNKERFILLDVLGMHFRLYGIFVGLIFISKDLFLEYTILDLTFSSTSTTIKTAKQALSKKVSAGAMQAIRLLTMCAMTSHQPYPDF